MERIETGIKELDSLLKGGLPARTGTLLVGNPGTGKTTLGLQFLYHGLERGDGGVYITTYATPSQIVEHMCEFGWNVKKYLDKLLFIDCYSWRVGSTEEEVVSPHELNELSVRVSKSMEKLKIPQDDVRVVMDSVSELLLHDSPESVFRFMETLTGRIKMKGGSALFAVEEGIHDSNIISTFNYLTDNTIRLSLQETKRYLSVPRVLGTDFIPDQIPFWIDGKTGLRMGKKR